MFKNKKVLFLTNLLPFSYDNGGKIKTSSSLKVLVDNGFDVTLACFYEGNQKDVAEIVDKSSISVSRIICFNKALTTSGNTFQMFWIAFLSLFSKLPFGILKYKSLRLSKALRRLCSEEEYDFVYFDHLQMMVFKKEVSSVNRMLLDEHNCETELAKQRFDLASNWLKRFFFWLEYKKMHKFESNALKETDRTILLSGHDRDELRLVAKDDFCYDIIPIAVRDRGVKSYRAKMNPLRILFLGTLTWEPNRQGIEWFMEEVMPFTRESELVVVGRGIDKGWENENIRILGYVDQLERVYNECDVMVVPLFMGSGQRVKIIEAFSKGMPVITTSVGIEGIEYIDGENVMIANNSEEFLVAIKRIADNNTYSKLAKSARQSYEIHYSEGILEKKLLASIDALNE